MKRSLKKIAGFRGGYRRNSLTYLLVVFGLLQEIEAWSINRVVVRTNAFEVMLYRVIY